MIKINHCCWFDCELDKINECTAEAKGHLFDVVLVSIQANEQFSEMRLCAVGWMVWGI